VRYDTPVIGFAVYITRFVVNSRSDHIPQKDMPDTVIFQQSFQSVAEFCIIILSDTNLLVIRHLPFNTEGWKKASMPQPKTHLFFRQ
jgi:hypothetical protein